MSSNWVNSFLLGYQPIAHDTPESRNTNIPGYFPLEEGESAEPAARNRFNSQNIKNHFKRIWEYVQIVVIKPLIFLLYILFTIIAKLVNVIYFRDQLKRQRLHSGSLNDPVNRSNKFIRDIEENLQVNQNHSMIPPFYQGSYTQALYMATHKAKFLFVYLTNPENETSSSIFNRIILNDKFRRLFDDQDFLIWGGDLTNPESYQLANSLNVTKFPFLGLLALTRTTTMTPEGPVKGHPKISLLVKIQGEISEDTDVNALIQNKFIKKIEKYGPELKLIRRELLDKFVNEVFTKQQDLNYQKSLEKDRLKKQKKQQEQLQKEYLVWKLQRFKEMNLEGMDKAKIAIKLPNGERVTHYFAADDDIVEIFNYVELYRNGYFDKSYDSSVIDESKFEGFVPNFSFRLMSPLPPKITLNDQLHNNILIKNLNCVYPNGLLIAETLEE